MCLSSTMLQPLSNDIAPIGDPCGALYKARLFRRQKHADIGNLVWLTHPLHRRGLDLWLEMRIRVVCRGVRSDAQRSSDDTGAEGVDSDAIFRVVDRIASSQANDSGFGRAVCSCDESLHPYHRLTSIGSTDQAELTGNVDNRPALPPVPLGRVVLLLHNLQLLLGAQKHPSVVHRVDLVKLVQAQLARGAGLSDDARAVDRIVDPPKLRLDLVEERLDRGRVGDVEGLLEDLDRGVDLAQLLCGGVQRLGLDVGDGDSRTSSFDKRLGSSVPDACEVSVGVGVQAGIG